MYSTWVTLLLLNTRIFVSKASKQPIKFGTFVLKEERLGTPLKRIGNYTHYRGPWNEESKLQNICRLSLHFEGKNAKAIYFYVHITEYGNIYTKLTEEQNLRRMKQKEFKHLCIVRIYFFFLTMSICNLFKLVYLNKGKYFKELFCL